MIEGDNIRVLTFKYGEIKNPGGINKVVLKTNIEMTKMGHECIVITTNSLDYPREEVYEGFKIVRIKSRIGPYFYGLSLRVYLNFKIYFKDLNPNIIHIHGYHGLSFPELVFILNKYNEKKVPIIFSPHLDTFRSTIAGKYLWEPYNLLIGKRLFKCATHIIVGSEFESMNVQRMFDVRSEKISVIPLGVNFIEPITPTKKNGQIDLVYAGYLIKRKGVHFILESVHSLVYDFKIENILLTIIGEGPEKKRLLKMAKELEIEKYVIWKTFLPIDEFIQNIKDSNIFLLLSESEAFGITVAEALALGKPCIVTNNTALKEFAIESGCFCVNYPPSPKETAELIIKISKTNVKVGPFSDKIRTWDKVAQDYEKTYKKYCK